MQMFVLEMKSVVMLLQVEYIIWIIMFVSIHMNDIAFIVAVHFPDILDSNDQFPQITGKS